MATVFDAATYVVERLQETTAMKLQKLVYYCQAWSLVWDEAELFPEEFQAWANGPVCRELYNRHSGLFKITPGVALGGDSAQLTQGQKATIDAVLGFYGGKTAQWLVDLTHLERPWQEARGGKAINEPGTDVIPKAKMLEYYSGLQAAQSPEG